MRLYVALFLYAVALASWFCCLLSGQAQAPQPLPYLVHCTTNGADTYTPSASTDAAMVFINNSCRQLVPARTVAPGVLPVPDPYTPAGVFVELLKVTVVPVEVKEQAVTTIPQPVTTTKRTYTVKK